jgi:hypothetical protein
MYFVFINVFESLTLMPSNDTCLAMQAWK